MKTGMNENSGSQPQRILERKKDTLRYKNKPSKNYENYPNEKNVTPTEIDVSQNKFLWMFKWTDSLIKAKDWENLEATIVQFNDIFARHRLDIGMNMQFKASLTPKDDEKPVYTQSLPVPINLKEDLSVELALRHRYGIITTLPFPKYASPIFVQLKPNGKVSLLVDLRKINTLIADDYINNNHPISTLSDAAQHVSGKTLLQTRLLPSLPLPPNG